MNNFLQPGNTDKFFILKGSAGTGKTTLMNAITGTMSDNFKQVIITAPTNKASKVLPLFEVSRLRYQYVLSGLCLECGTMSTKRKLEMVRADTS